MIPETRGLAGPAWSLPRLRGPRRSQAGIGCPLRRELRWRRAGRSLHGRRSTWSCAGTFGPGQFLRFLWFIAYLSASVTVADPRLLVVPRPQPPLRRPARPRRQPELARNPKAASL